MTVAGVSSRNYTSTGVGKVAPPREPRKVLVRMLVFAIVGIAYLVVFSPQVLIKIASIDYSESSWFSKLVNPEVFHTIIAPFQRAAQFSSDVSLPNDVVRTAITVAVSATVAVVAATLVRSIRGREGTTFSTASLTLLIGILFVPAFCWIVWIGVRVAHIVELALAYVWRVLLWITHAIGAFFVWSAPFWAIIGALVGLAVVGLVIYECSTRLRKNSGSRWIALVTIVLAMLTAAIWVGIAFDWWTTLGAALLSVAKSIGAIIVFAAQWLVLAFLWLLGAFLAVGLLIAVLLYPGFILFKTVSGAFAAGRANRQHAVSFASGIGVAWSLALTTLATAPTAPLRLSGATAGLLDWLVGGYSYLIPIEFEEFLGQFGSGLDPAIDPTLDFFLIGAVGVVGSLTLAFGIKEIENRTLFSAVFVAALVGMTVLTVFMAPIVAGLVLLVVWVINRLLAES